MPFAEMGTPEQVEVRWRRQNVQPSKWNCLDSIGGVRDDIKLGIIRIWPVFKVTGLEEISKEKYERRKGFVTVPIVNRLTITKLSHHKKCN